MTRQILFIHSAGNQWPHQGSRDIVDYLRQNLGAAYEVHYPEMPKPEEPEYELWKNAITPELNKLDEPVILVGHSLGGSILLKYLSEEKISQSISGLFLVSTPFWRKDKEWSVQFALVENFASRLPDIQKIFLYHSRDDEWVPFSHLFTYAEQLPQAVIRKFGIRGHNFDTGFPELVADIRSL